MLTLFVAAWLSIFCAGCFTPAQASEIDRHPCATDIGPGHMDCCDEDGKGRHACHSELSAALPGADHLASLLPSSGKVQAVLSTTAFEAGFQPLAASIRPAERGFPPPDIPLFLQHCAFLN